MTTLFQQLPGVGSSQNANVPRRTMIQGLLAGSGLVGGGTVVFGVIELVKAQPDKAFRLLDTWGPWFFLAIFSVWAANGLMNRGLDVLERLGDAFSVSFDKVAAQQEKLAESQEKLAIAAQQSADKDNREADRISTLVEYSAQQSRETKEAIGGLAQLVNRMADRVEHLAAGKEVIQ